MLHCGEGVGDGLLGGFVAVVVWACGGLVHADAAYVGSLAFVEGKGGEEVGCWDGEGGEVGGCCGAVREGC